MARVLDKRDFRAKLDKLHPRYGKPTQLSLELRMRMSPIPARACDEAANRRGLGRGKSLSACFPTGLFV
jgi:hypothetical protein